MLTPAETLASLRRSHMRREYPVASCGKCFQNYPCDVVRAIDAATLAERERIRQAAGDDLPALLRKALEPGGGRA